MFRRTVAVLGLAAVAALTACGAHVSTSPAPKKPTLPPAEALAAAGVTPTATPSAPAVAPNPGTLTPCSQVPFPGPMAEEDQLHDCWVVEPLGSGNLSMYEFFMGGVSPTDRQHGLLVFERPSTGAARNVYDVPGTGGDVTVFLARWRLACYRTAAGATGEFDAERAAFVTNTARVQTDCARTP
jgi:hypothetical protein